MCQRGSRRARRRTRSSGSRSGATRDSGPHDTSAAGDAATGDAATFNHVNGVRRTANDDVDRMSAAGWSAGFSNTRGGRHSRKSASQFILTNARPGMGSGSAKSPGSTTYTTSPGNAPAAGGATAPGVPATPGASASDRPAASSMSYALDGQASQLKDHVGHQVEVTGRLNQSSSSPSSASPNADRDSSTRDSSRSASNTPMSRFDVQSVKMIAATCSR